VTALVRKAGRRDLEAIHALWRSLREHEAGLDPRLAPSADADAVAREHREIILADPRSAFFVAEEHGEVIGYLHAQIDTNDPAYEPARYGTIVDLFVREDRRGEGTADALLESCVEWFRSHALTEYRTGVPSLNRDAQAFFEKQGCEPLAVTYLSRLESRVRNPDPGAEL
jgi:GNAT superfamily N-acetyltransferase